MSIRAILLSLIQDRVVVTGGGIGGGSLTVAKAADHTILTVERLVALQPYAVFFATVFGGLCSFLTACYVAFKIYRLWKTPKALE
jgi:hypothetical protein